MIDILMTVYNGEQYVVPQIESILNQTDSNWKLFIQDDCSTDRTVELIEPYVRRYPERITLLRNEKNSGSAQKNFFSMLPLVEHSYCMFCDHDDVWKPRKVEMTVRRMMELEQANGQDTPLLVHTDLAVADENLKVLSDSMFRSQNLNRKGNRLNKLLVQNNVTGCTMMVNKALVDMVGPAPKHAVMHDWWMALIAACFGKIGFVRQATILYRQHRANEVGAKNARSLSYNARRLAEREQARKVLNDTYLQAREFEERYHALLKPEDLELLQVYQNLPYFGKLRRIAVLFRYHLFKHGLARILGQLLFV